jgi:hypothetical protein
LSLCRQWQARFLAGAIAFAKLCLQGVLNSSPSLTQWLGARRVRVYFFAFCAAAFSLKRTESNMDKTERKLTRDWVIYSAVVVFASVILVTTGERSVSPRSFRIADLQASHPGTLSELSKSKEWTKQLTFFDKAYLSPESSDWHSSPASRHISQDVVTFRQKLVSDHFVKLQIDGPAENIPLDKYTFDIKSAHFTFSRPLGQEFTLGPFPLQESVALRVSEQRGFFSSFEVAQGVPFVAGSLPVGQSAPVEMDVTSEYRGVLGQEKLHFQIQATKVDPDQLGAPQVSEAAGQTSEIPSKVVADSVSFDFANVSHDLFITPASRYTTLIISTDQDPRGYVSCKRSDNGDEVGAYSEGLRLVAVAVNGWASVNVHVAVHDFNEKVNYRIVALSSSGGSSKSLLLWFVTHDLTDKEVEGRVLSLPEIDERVRWLETALGVQFSAGEVADTANSNIKKLFNHLIAIR